MASADYTVLAGFAVMTTRELIECWAVQLETERLHLVERELDVPVVTMQGRLVRTTGGLHLYEFLVPSGVALSVDLPVGVVSDQEAEATEGTVLRQIGNAVLVLLFDSLGKEVSSVTLVPDQAGLVERSATRLKEILAKPDHYHLGPAERLASLLQTDSLQADQLPPSSSVLTTVWSDDRSRRRQTLATMAMDLIRANKRILLISPDHQESDEITGIIARTMKTGGLNYKTWISRYEWPVTGPINGIDLHELGFEAQMHQFYAKSQAEKASLRSKYERYRELAPFLALKEAKQKDLDEVRTLEWRLVTQLREVQIRMADVVNTLKDFENLSLFQRLSMQAVGKNAESLTQYRVLYQNQMDHLDAELDVAKQRIQELVPEAAVPRGMRAEFSELKEDMTKLGGTKKVRELLAAQEDPNRQAFIQNRRLVAATPTRVASDPLFSRVRFDVLIADEAPRMAAASLLAAAGLVRERIIVSGDPREIVTAGQWAMPHTSSHAAP